MPRPKGGYRLADGSRVPGITTVIGELGWNKRQLMFWAFKQGKEGADDLYEKRDEAGSIGTVVHALVEAQLRDPSAADEDQLVALEKQHGPFTPPMLEQIENAMLGFYEWTESVQLTVTHSELSLVSEEYRYGGTLDFAALIGGKQRRVLMELKSSDDVYLDHLLQMAAQHQLWKERFPDDPVTGFWLLNVGKQDGSFHHHYYPGLAPHFEAFVKARELYGLRRAIEGK